MEKNKIIIFNNVCRGAVYGVGTYIKTLTETLKDSNMDFSFVNLYGKGENVTKTTENELTVINIPSVKYNNRYGVKRYARNVSFLLREFITHGKDEKLIFHLNFMTAPELVISLKKMYPQSKILLVAHYTNWSFTLLGDKRKLYEILQKSASKRNLIERKIVSELKDDIRMIKKVDKFVCVAAHTLEPFIRFGGIDENKCLVINNAINDEYNEMSSEDRNELRSKYRISKDEEVILFVGRLDIVKGIGLLLESFDKILDSRPNAHLYLVGEGDFNTWLHYSKDNWSHISFTGHLNKQQVADFYNIADVGIIPSLHEEFGLVATEMMMYKLPIVVSDVGGLAEIVVDGETGLKVPISYDEEDSHTSSQIMCDKVIQLLIDKVFAKKLAKNGRSRFLRHYENMLFREKMLGLYNQL